jgi:hypothetical protein
VVWPRKLHFRTAAKGATASTMDAMAGGPIIKDRPRFLLVTDGEEVSARDTKADETLHIAFDKLTDRFDFFLPLAGFESYAGVKENQADVKASGKLSKLYDEIVAQNPGWTAPEKRHALNQFMTRLLFCMFAEDTGSFAKDLFVKTISMYGGNEGRRCTRCYPKCSL